MPTNISMKIHLLAFLAGFAITAAAHGNAALTTQQAYLKASDTSASSFLGFSVAISGDTAVVGAYTENGSRGAAYVYVRNGGVWTQQQKLTASNAEAGDSFGYSVAISGETLVVGAYTEDSGSVGVNGLQTNNTAPDSGAAYVFTRSGGIWAQQAYLKASNSEISDFFGESVAITGETIVIGAYGEDSGSDSVNSNQVNNSAIGAGAAYVFTRSAGVWAQQAYLKASNSDASDRFGESVAIAGETIVVGATDEDSGSDGVDGNQVDNTVSNAGAAYVFTRSAGAWAQQAYLKASNSDAADNFGYSVAIAGETLVIGATGEDSGNDGVNSNQADNSASSAGAAYVFARSGGAWTQQAYLKASNSDVEDYFGVSVAIAGETIVVGATGEDSGSDGANGNQADNTMFSAGAAYVLTRSGGAWAQQAYLKASNSDANDFFGIPVAIDGETIVVGAPYEDSITTGINSVPNDAGTADGSGAAYIYTFPGPPPPVVQFAVKVKTNTKLGKVTGAGTFAQGSKVTLTAKPRKDITFLGWYEGKKLLSKKKKLTLTNLTKNRKLTAKFK